MPTPPTGLAQSGCLIFTLEGVTSSSQTSSSIFFMLIFEQFVAIVCILSVHLLVHQKQCNVHGYIALSVPFTFPMQCTIRIIHMHVYSYYTALRLGHALTGKVDVKVELIAGVSK